MQELQPHIVLKQLELDLQDPQRAVRGTAVLPRMLWTGDQPREDIAGAGMSRSQYLDKVMPLLTALEQVRCCGCTAQEVAVRPRSMPAQTSKQKCTGLGATAPDVQTRLDLEHLPLTCWASFYPRILLVLPVPQARPP